MAIYYVDPVNGNDSNDGSSWAQAWQTFTSGATALRITAGDVIRVAKSPDPTTVGSATWTNDSDQVVLSSAVTKDITDGTEAWTPSANVTEGAGSSGVTGNSRILTIGTSFTTGKVAYLPLGSAQDFSSFQQICLSIWSQTAQVAGTFQFKLCSDTTGNTPVDSVDIPYLVALRGTKLTFDTGSALGSSIQSVAIYATVDPGAVQIAINNSFASKAPSSADSLSLNSLIGLSSDAQSVEWYPIRGIIGTTVYLCSDRYDANNDTSMLWKGSTASYTTYKRDCIITPTSFTTDANTSSDWRTTESANANAVITYSGGWDTGTTIQNGMTIIQGKGIGSGIYTSSDYINFEYLGFQNFQYGFYSSNSDDSSCNNCLSVGSGYGFYYASGINIKLTNCFSSSRYYGTGANLVLSNIKGRGDGYLYFVGNSDAVILFADVNVSAISAVTAINSVVKAKDCILQASSGIVTNTRGMLFSHNHNQTADYHYQNYYRGIANSQVSDRHTASGIAWTLEPNGFASTDFPLRFKIATVLVPSGSTATAKVWVKKNNATSISGRLILLGGYLSGVSSDQIDTKADDTDWEELSISFTPTESSAVSIYVDAIYNSGAGGTITVDDFSLTTA